MSGRTALPLCKSCPRSSPRCESASSCPPFERHWSCVDRVVTGTGRDDAERRGRHSPRGSVGTSCPAFSASSGCVVLRHGVCYLEICFRGNDRIPKGISDARRGKNQRWDVRQHRDWSAAGTRRCLSDATPSHADRDRCSEGSSGASGPDRDQRNKANIKRGTWTEKRRPLRTSASGSMV